MVLPFPLLRFMSQAMNPEAVIIGGGLAGAATAALLSTQGRNVMLLDKEPVPHHKVCGEFISWEAVHYLKRLGIDLPSLGAQPIDHLHLGFGEHSVRTDLPFRAWSLSRLKLDQAVLAVAQERGAIVKLGNAVTALKQESGGWLIETTAGSIHTPTVFLASGKSDLRGWPRPATAHSNFIGFKMHFHLKGDQIQALRHQVEMLLFNGGYAGMELVENDIANLCLLINKDQYAACQKDWTCLLEALQRDSPILKRRLEGAIPVWQKPLAVYGMPYGHLHRDKKEIKGLYRLGDQMAVISSFTGDGMAMALHSAFVASNCYLKGESGAVYHDKIFKDFRKPVKMARRISAFALTKKTQPLLHLLFHAWPGSLRWAARAVRLNMIS